MGKFEQLYNAEGKVNSPEVAHNMAKMEDELRKQNHSQEMIDSSSNIVGELEQEKENIKALADKIKMSLSPDELKFIRDLFHEDSMDNQMKLFKGIME